eukprot:6460117-Amphidinium_carterae.2
MQRDVLQGQLKFCFCNNEEIVAFHRKIWSRSTEGSTLFCSLFEFARSAWVTLPWVTLSDAQCRCCLAKNERHVQCTPCRRAAAAFHFAVIAVPQPQ